jgi:hypothetical protein
MKCFILPLILVVFVYVLDKDEGTSLIHRLPNAIDSLHHQVL